MALTSGLLVFKIAVLVLPFDVSMLIGVGHGFYRLYDLAVWQCKKSLVIPVWLEAPFTFFKGHLAKKTTSLCAIWLMGEVSLILGLPILLTLLCTYIITTPGHCFPPYRRGASEPWGRF